MKYSRIYTAMHGVCTDAFHWRIVVESLNKTDRYSVSSVVILRVDPNRYFVNVRFCEFLSFFFLIFYSRCSVIKCEMNYALA